MPALREPIRWIEPVARLGYLSIGFVYIVAGCMTAAAAAGAGGQAASWRDAIAEVNRMPLGSAALVVIVIGLLGYSIWLCISAVTDSDQRGRDAKGIALRLRGVASAVIHVAMAVSIVRFLTTHSAGGSGGDRAAKMWTARLMDAPFGRWFVALAGVIFVGYGVYSCWKAWEAKLGERLHIARIRARELLVAVCRFGIAARGVVVAVIGGSIIEAAVHHNPERTKATKGALLRVAQEPYGRILLLILSLGLIAYGFYSMVKAKYRTVRVVAILLLAGCASSRPDMARDVDRILQRHPGKTIAVAYMDLGSGSTLLRNEHEVFHAASTMKVPVMLGIFEAVARGELRLDQPVRVRNTFTSIFDGSPFELKASDDSDNDMYALIGRDVPLEELVRHMIVRSSNLATNNIIELIGARRVMELMQRIGANDIKVLRGVEDQKAFDAGMNNTTTAYDLMLIFAALGQQKIVSPDASRKMIDILAGQQFNSGIPAGLPAGTRVGHKTGDITLIQHDGGIVLPEGSPPYVLVVLTRGFRDHGEANRVIASISHAVWRARTATR